MSLTFVEQSIHETIKNAGKIDKMRKRLVRVVFLFVSACLFLPQPLFAEEIETLPIDQDPRCEHLVQSFDVWAIIKAGKVEKHEIVCPHRNLSEIRIKTSINVLVVIKRFIIKERARLVFDEHGLKEFYSVSEENDVVSEWEGKREENDFIVWGRTGPAENMPPMQERRFKKWDFSYTNYEDFQYVVALTNRKWTFSVLNVRNGNLETHSVKPLGPVSCPLNTEGPCYKTYTVQPNGEGEGILNGIGQIVGFDGSDSRGPYRIEVKKLKEVPPFPEIERFVPPTRDSEASSWWRLDAKKTTKKTAKDSDSVKVKAVDNKENMKSQESKDEEVKP